MKSHILISIAALSASTAGVSDAAVRELQPITKRDNSEEAPSEPCDEEVLKVYLGVCRLESDKYDKVVKEYCLEDTKWAPTMAHKALLIAATNGHINSQAELVKCYYNGTYGADRDITHARLWLDNVLVGTDVDCMYDLQEFFDNDKNYSRFGNEAKNLIAMRLKAMKVPERRVQEPKEIVVCDSDGALSSAYVNYIVEHRLSLLISNNVEAGVFESLFTDDVLEMKSGKAVPRATLLAKAQKIVHDWPKRGVEILEVGVSGLQVEICFAFLYVNSSGKEVAAYNKTTLLINSDGKIAGMQEIITAGDRPSISPKYQNFDYTGPRRIATNE